MSKDYLTPSMMSSATAETAAGYQSQALLVTGIPTLITGIAEKETDEGRHSSSELVTGVTKQTA